MKIYDIFKSLKSLKYNRFKELGAYRSVFSVFGNDIYASPLVRASIRPLADLSSKAYAVCEDKKLERLLNTNPNKFMTGRDLVYKVRVRYELLNTAFIYLQRNDAGKIIGFYPVPYNYFEAVEYNNGLFIKFYFNSTEIPELVLPWEDLVPIRKDYNKSDIAGDDNSAIIATLEQLNTIDEGMANAIRATANLRGILKNTRAMLAPELVKEQKDIFVQEYMSLENAGGIASLDSTQEFTPIKLDPLTANYEHVKEKRENIYRYFGVNDNIVMGDIKTEQLENFHKLRIEPFLIALSQALTNKVFAGKSGAYEKNVITYIAEQGQFMTMSQKLQLYTQVVLYGGLTRNEWRKMMGYAPVPGGDEMIMRLDASSSDVAMGIKAKPDSNTENDSKDAESDEDEDINESEEES